MGELVNDLRLALRGLKRQPTFFSMVVLILTAGISGSACIFAVVSALVLHPLPYHEPDRLVQLWESAPTKGYGEVEASPANYDDWVAQNQVFSGMAAYAHAARNLTGNGLPERVVGSQVTSNLFPVLGATAARGRTLLPEEDGNDGPAVVVLSDGF